MKPFVRRALPWVLFFVAYVCVGLLLGRFNLPTWLDWVRYGVFGGIFAWFAMRQGRKPREGKPGL